MAWQWSHFLPASKTRWVTMDLVCHIMFNQKLSCVVYAKSCLTSHYCINSKKWCKFSSFMKAKLWKKKLHKKRPACIVFNILNDSFGCMKGCYSSTGWNITTSNNTLASGLIEKCISLLYICINHCPS
jgi:hypothetical protein